MSAQKYQRVGWLARQIAEGKTNAQIVSDMQQMFPGVSEAVARKDLKQVLTRMTEIELECLPVLKARFLEMGFKLLDEARGANQYGPAMAQFKTLAVIAGVYQDKPSDVNVNVGLTGQESLVKQRIKDLMKSKNVQDKAQELGLDLAEMSKDK